MYIYGEMPEQIDHINHNRSDNKISNLRSVTDAENKKNMSLPSNNKSGAIGVSWYEGRKTWVAQLRVNGVTILNKHFKSKKDAIEARMLEQLEQEFHDNHGEHHDVVY